MEPCQEVFDIQNSGGILPPLPISQFKVLALYTKQEMDEYLGTFLSADPDFFPLTRPTTWQATHSTPNNPTQVVNTLYPDIH